MAQKLTMKVLSEELDSLRAKFGELELDVERKLEGVLEKAADKLKAHIDASEGVAFHHPMTGAGVAVDERRKLIAEAAYLRAEIRGFAPGNSDQDWLEAEREVDWMLLHGWVKNAPQQDEEST